MPRFLAANRTMDAAVLVLPDDPLDDLAEARRRLAALPEVQQVFQLTEALILAGVDPTDPRAVAPSTGRGRPRPGRQPRVRPPDRGRLT